MARPRYPRPLHKCRCHADARHRLDGSFERHARRARAVVAGLSAGSFLRESPKPLAPCARCIGEWLEHWAAHTPQAVALAQRDADGEWCRIAYGALRHQVGAMAPGLLDMALPAGRPAVVLCDNALDHALLMLACLHIGRPVCTASSAPIRAPRPTPPKIGAILRALEPALVYASDAPVYRRTTAAAPWPPHRPAPT